MANTTYAPFLSAPAPPSLTASPSAFLFHKDPNAMLLSHTVLVNSPLPMPAFSLPPAASPPDFGSFSDTSYGSQDSILLLENPALFPIENDSQLSWISDVSPVVRGRLPLSSTFHNAQLAPSRAPATPFVNKLMSASQSDSSSSTRIHPSFMDSAIPRPPLLSSPLKLKSPVASSSTRRLDNASDELPQASTSSNRPMYAAKTNDLEPLSPLSSIASPYESLPPASKRKRAAVDKLAGNLPPSKRPRNAKTTKATQVVPSASPSPAQTPAANATIRTFGSGIAVSAASFPLFYRRFPVSAYIQLPGLK